MTAEQFIAGTLSVTDYLRNRCDKEKIYLMAHSGGAFIGLQAAARLPAAYHAYIGVAQVVDQRRSEALAYELSSSGSGRTAIAAWCAGSRPPR